MMIQGLKADDAIDKWPEIRPIVDRALRYGDVLYDSDWLFERIIDRDIQCWIIDDVKAVILTQINVYPLGKELEVKLVAGDDMTEWFEHMDAVLTDFARYYGCKQIKGYGRKGWERQTKKTGWRFSSLSVVKHVGRH